MTLSPPAPTTDEIWRDLLTWLSTFENGSKAVNPAVQLVDTAAGRGLVATTSISSSTPLIQVPVAALVNPLTLAPLYPSSFARLLTSTQWLSLHLSLQSSRWRRPDAEKNPRDRFSTFLRTLPLEFPSVPLSWAVAAKTLEEQRKEFELKEGDPGVPVLEHKERWAALLRHLPKSCQWRQVDVHNRFRNDWLLVTKVWDVLSPEEQAGDELLFADFLLAWLNVNTRCVYYDIGGKTSDNLTLAPVIDMINHKDGLNTTPVAGALALSFSSPPYASSDPPLSKGSELLFSYGPHEDPMLLTEYGFTLGSRTNAYNSVKIDDEVAALFAKQGDIGKAKQQILEDESYWGLLHLRIPSSTPPPSSLEKWYDLLAGVRDTISTQNEKAVKASLTEIGEKLEEEFGVGLRKFLEMRDGWVRVGGVGKTLMECADMVRGVWKEESRIVEEVLQGLESQE
ncbi:putative protein lysine methyltransferase [Pseudohyphozyma bogoriensis]|nr:putative protein lysine methyltransferase [Pseudohyphozyma bogoriensis]